MMSSPAPKKRKLTRHSVVTIELPDPLFPSNPPSTDESEAEKPPSPAIYVAVEGSEPRFKCNAKALQRSTYFAKHLPEADSEAATEAEVVLTVPRTVSVERLKLALAWMHIGIDNRDCSIPQYTTGIHLNERYIVARIFGIEGWENNIIDAHCIPLHLRAVEIFARIERADMKDSPLTRLLLEYLAWKMRRNQMEWKTILSELKGPGSKAIFNPPTGGIAADGTLIKSRRSAYRQNH
ncbi:hypothetical protein LTR13_000722 [Exophiala sideris]|nr:hypothetical protein LTR13_000722 [Exophiala sideris]